MAWEFTFTSDVCNFRAEKKNVLRRFTPRVPEAGDEERKCIRNHIYN